MERLPLNTETSLEVECPSCGEIFAVMVVLPFSGQLAWVEDCQVCCRPATISVRVEDGEVLSLEAIAS